MGCWLVTGATGFLGRHILNGLKRAEVDDVITLGRRCPEEVYESSHVFADLGNLSELRLIIDKICPSIVIHAAGKTPPASAEELYQGNTLVTVHLLDALRSLDQPVRVVLVGSAAEWGPIADNEFPVKEEHPCHPVDAYGLSKLLATTAGLAMKSPIDVMVGRVFNPIGPGLPTSQAFGRFAALLAQPGSGPCRLEVGNLEPKRDFVNVRDVANALVALAERGSPERIYNIGTGRSHSVKEGLERLIALSGREVEIVSNAAASRGPADSRASIHRILADTGWSAEIAWEQSLADLWDEVRRRPG